ncbi:hypothetical protein HMPREF9612_00694 [Cutibacterium acnes HL063PA2]|nr:hypothetical protein HMPREF9612_00694 [Cutibacterium acnes HL063PA2]
MTSPSSSSRNGWKRVLPNLVLLNSPIRLGTNHVRARTMLRSGEIVTGLLLSRTGQDV